MMPRHAVLAMTRRQPRRSAAHGGADLAYVPGKKFIDKPLFVLTSANPITKLDWEGTGV